jgi:6,7-dimethyl-8-ribityllumazine synthase
MSKLVPSRPRVNNVPRAFVLVASQFNSKYVQGLIEHCTDELRSLSPTSSVNLVMVPGAFEIPLVVREIALKKEADAIVALGVILEGDTAHARQLGDTVTHSLQQISLEHGLPVIHVVLSLKDEEQAKKRCLENEMNRGTEAARAALAMTNVLAELRR